MPGMNGYELATHAVALRSEIRVAYMSGYVRDFGARHGTQGPAGAFIQKPFTPEGLARKVREALDGAPVRSASVGTPTQQAG